MDIVRLNTTSVWTYQMSWMGRLIMPMTPLSEFVARACVNRLEVLDGKPGFANSPLPKFFTKARCPPVLAPFRVAAVKVYV